MNTDEAQKFSERFKISLSEAGFPDKGKGRLKTLAKLFDITPQAIARWLNGEVFPTKKINQIAEKLKVNPHWLLTGQGNMNPHSNIIFAPGVPVTGNKELSSYKWQKVPIITWSEAGNWHSSNFIPNENVQYIWATTETDNQHFALIIDDDSMQPRFFPGNILIFDPSLNPVHKNRILVKWKKTGQVICGVLIVHGPSKTLKPHNPDYKPIPLDNPNDYEFIAVCRQVFIVEK